MRLLLHCVYYRPEVGGLESHVADLAEGLAARGHEVRVVTSRSRPEFPSDEEIARVRIRRTWFPVRSPLGWGLHALGSIPTTIAWARWADVLHAQTFASAVPVGVAAAFTGRPWVTSFHTSHFLTRARRPGWRSLLRRIVRWPGHALAASSEIAEVARALSPGTRVEAVTNGVETDRFRSVPPILPPSAEGPTIVVPRRLFPKNGVEYIVRAVPRIRETFPGLRVLVVGDGPERVRLEELAAALGVASAVRFLGARPREEMPGLLCSGEIVALPSLMEATSVAALEAMACERPVLATNVGGLPEIVDDTVGALVPARSSEALAEGAIRLLGDPDLKGKGKRARARVVARWSNARLVSRHEEIYEDLVARRPVRGPETGSAVGSRNEGREGEA